MNASRGMKSFEDYEMEPSPQVWENIKQNIPSPARKRRVAAWWLLAAAVAGISLGGLYFFEFDIKLRQRPTPQVSGTIERPVDASNPSAHVSPVTVSPQSGNSGSRRETTALQATGAGKTEGTQHSITRGSGNSRKQTTATVGASHSIVANVSSEKTTTGDVQSPGAGSWNGTTSQSSASSVEKLSGITFYLPAQKGAVPEKLQASSGDVELAPRRNRNSRWQWSAMGALDYCYRNVRIDASETLIPSTAPQEELAANETALQTFSTSITAGYSFSTHFSLVSGVSFFSTGQQRNQSQVALTTASGGESIYAVITSAGVLTGSGQQFDEAFFNNRDSSLFLNTVSVQDHTTDESFQLEQQFQYVSIPLMVHYQPAERRFTPYIGVGISAAYLTGEKISLNGNELDYQYGEQLHDFLFSAEAQAGIKYRFSRHIAAGVQPSFRYGLNSLNGNDDVHWIPYSFGIGFGINYRY